MTSTIYTNKIASNIQVVLATIATVAVDTVANSNWLGLPRVQDMLFMLHKTSAAAAKLTGFHIQVIGNMTNEATPREIAIDVNGDLVIKASIDAGTGVGATPAVDGLLMICTVKDRFELCAPTKIDSAAAPPVVTGDTGQEGNQYLLELQMPEMSSVQKECKTPCFYRLCVTSTDAAATYTLATVLDGHNFANDQLTAEVIN